MEVGGHFNKLYIKKKCEMRYERKKTSVGYLALCEHNSTMVFPPISLGRKDYTNNNLS